MNATRTPNLNNMKAGELIALYILTMRGFSTEFAPNEIQDQLESLIGDNLTIDAIRRVRSAIDEI